MRWRSRFLIVIIYGLLFGYLTLLNVKYGHVIWDFPGQSYDNVLQNATVTLQSLKSRSLYNSNAVKKKESSSETYFYVPEEKIESVYKDDRILEQINMFDPSRTPFLKPKITIYIPDGSPSWGVEMGAVQFSSCPASNCVLVEHISPNVDAVLFRNFLRPVDRLGDQIWIFYTLESPTNAPLKTGDYSQINWTATYRLDSDIVTPYGKYVAWTEEQLFERQRQMSTSQKIFDDKPPINFAQNKNKLIAWFVSNCHTDNDRMGYATRLQRHLSIDIFGRCSDKQCAKSVTCFDMLKKEYKFYLSFENSNCRDYISEKFFSNALENDIVPIVMGAKRQDYERLAPPNSFIHVDDFESPEKLALYILALDQNDTMYNRFFDWKNQGRLIDTKFWCRLCAMLNLHSKSPLPTSNQKLDQWWGGKEVCNNSQKLFDDEMNSIFN